MSWLQQIEGHLVHARIPMLDHSKYLVEIRVHKVEESGLWIESNDLTQAVLQDLNEPALTRTPILFVPFQQIAFVVATAQGVSLSEQSFGVQPQR
jgi:hypothetical protein